MRRRRRSADYASAFWAVLDYYRLATKPTGGLRALGLPRLNGSGWDEDRAGSESTGAIEGVHARHHRGTRDGDKG
ncbi:hypothetical protein GCM10028789_26910 [Sinomonas halotolerans]